MVYILAVNMKILICNRGIQLEQFSRFFNFLYLRFLAKLLVACKSRRLYGLLFYPPAKELFFEAVKQRSEKESLFSQAEILFVDRLW